MASLRSTIDVLVSIRVHFSGAPTLSDTQRTALKGNGKAARDSRPHCKRQSKITLTIVALQITDLAWWQANPDAAGCRTNEQTKTHGSNWQYLYDLYEYLRLEALFSMILKQKHELRSL